MKFNKIKCKQIALSFNCHNKFPFFRKDHIVTNFLFYCYKMTTLKCPAGYILVLVLFEDSVLVNFITKIC